jgi:Cu+-exporting ATPase
MIVFDKTGTLTQGRPDVTDIVALNQKTCDQPGFGEAEKTVLKLAAVAERNSEHPLARSLMKKASELAIVVDEASSFKAVPGRGVKAVYKGKDLLVGSVRLLKEKGIDVSLADEEISRLQEEGQTTVIVAYGKKLIGVVGFMDTPKTDAEKTLSSLERMGIEVLMLTGDNERTANAVAKILHIDRVLANVLPGEKAAKVKQLQDEGKVVAMVGDGVNDAPALTQADVGFAIGSGTDIAIEAGSVVLVRDDLQDVVVALETGRKTMSKIRQNLFWAFVYNILLIPSAAAGLLFPTTAALAMALSSVSVTSSSLLMRRWKPSGKA